MSSVLAYMTGTGSWPRLWQAVAVISLLLGGGALAQTGNGGVQNAKVQSAYADWRRLSQTEVNCVDQSLRGQRSSLWALIQRGIDSSDATVARLRADCRAQARAPNSSVTAPSGSQALASARESAADKAAEKAAADKAAAEKAAADKAAADRTAAEKAAASKAAADKATADQAAADKAAQKAAAEQAAVESAKAEIERAKTGAMQAQADADRMRKDAEKATVDAVFAYAAAESRMSFIYGLISSPICFGLGGAVFLWGERRRKQGGTQSEAPAPDPTNPDSQGEFDRLVTAVLAEQKRRESVQPETAASPRGQRIDETLLH